MSSFIYTNFKKIEKFQHKIWNKFLCRIKNFKWKLTSLQQVATSSNWKNYIWKSTQKKCQMVILGLSLENYNIDSLNHSLIDISSYISFWFSQAYYVKVFACGQSNWKTTWNKWFSGRFLKKTHNILQYHWSFIHSNFIVLI
jgi:hypothetical protein